MDSTDLSLSNLVESPTAPTRISSSFGAHHVLQERSATAASAYSPSGYVQGASLEAKRALDNSGSVLYLPPLPNAHLSSTNSFGEGLLSQINIRFQHLNDFADAAKESVSGLPNKD
jgi:hypothetical protein